MRQAPGGLRALQAHTSRTHPPHVNAIGVSPGPARVARPRSRYKTRPTRLKTAFFGRFGLAGRTFSRTGHRHVATMQPMTPLQPLMQASVKPPSPMLAPEQQALKPTTPLQPKNALKTPISHPQRRQGFQSRLGRRPQRRRWFQTTRPSGLQDPDAIPVGGCGARGRWRVPGFPKSRMQFDWMKIQ